MTNFTNAVEAVLAAYFETGDSPTQAQFAAVLAAIQDAFETHTHTAAGAGTGEGASLGASSITNRSRTLFVPVQGGWNNTASAYIIAYSYLSLPDAAVAYGSARFAVPEDFVSGMTVEAVVFTSEPSANVYVKLSADYGADGQAIDTHSEAGSYSAVATGNAMYKEMKSLSLSSAAKDDYVGVTFWRDATSGSDTLNGSTLYLVGFRVTYTADS